MVRRNKQEKVKELLSKRVVIAKCVGCGAKRDIKAGEIPKGEQPMCHQCGDPMIAESAEIRDSFI